MLINTNQHPVLNTTRLILRPLRPTDAENIFKIRSDESINTYVDRNPTTSIEDAANFIRNINRLTTNGDGLYWGIILAEGDQLIGTICLYNFAKEKNIAEIGYELLPVFQGKGLMQEAITEVINYSFGTVKIKVLIASPRLDNQSSIKLLERNKFVTDPAYIQPDDQDAGKYLVYVLRNRE